MGEEEIKFLTIDNKVIALKDLFEGKERTRKLMANLSFEEKIRILVSLQEIAYSWGNKKDMIVWKL